MGAFVKDPEFAKLNLGFSLDEGIASENDDYLVFYAERNVWPIKVTCPGNPGHGSKFIENTAAEKIVIFVLSILCLLYEDFFCSGT